MALPACTRCGKTDPQKMFGLMTHWFGPFVDLRPDHGYFHLCPHCYRTEVQPHLESVQGKLAELHPLAARQLEHEGSGNGARDAVPAGPAARARAADEAARRSVVRKSEGSGGPDPGPASGG